ncbi:MAG: hypothetical protein ABR962_05600 [Candidatus Bathyarchaeia archaeon]|jgi:hypothetical protein
MGDIITEDEDTAQKREKQQGLERSIEEAKWDMYAERWDLAEKQLQEARETAVRLRNKDKIDVILELLGKCKAKEKVELGK